MVGARAGSINPEARSAVPGPAVPGSHGPHRMPGALRGAQSRQPQPPYKYFGSHSVSPGQMYMNTMHRITISMYGIIPANI